MPRQSRNSKGRERKEEKKGQEGKEEKKERGDGEEEGDEVKEGKGANGGRGRRKGRGGRRGRKASRESESEDSAVAEVDAVSVFASWQRNRLRRMLDRASPTIRSEVEAFEQGLRATGRTPAQIDESLTSFLTGKGCDKDLDINPEKEKFVRTQLKTVEKYKMGQNWKVWVSKLDRILQGAVEDRLKIALTMDLMEEGARNMIQQLKVEDWSSWVEQSVKLLQSRSEVWERRTDMYKVVMDLKEKPSDFLRRCRTAVSDTDTWSFWEE